MLIRLLEVDVYDEEELEEGEILFYSTSMHCVLFCTTLLSLLFYFVFCFYPIVFDSILFISIVSYCIRCCLMVF